MATKRVPGVAAVSAACAVMAVGADAALAEPKPVVLPTQACGFTNAMAGLAIADAHTPFMFLCPLTVPGEAKP
jgi:hypothetical protein